MRQVAFVFLLMATGACLGQIARVCVAIIFLLIIIFELLPMANLHPVLR